MWTPNQLPHRFLIFTNCELQPHQMKTFWLHKNSTLHNWMYFEVFQIICPPSTSNIQKRWIKRSGIFKRSGFNVWTFCVYSYTWMIHRQTFNACIHWFKFHHTHMHACALSFMLLPKLISFIKKSKKVCFRPWFLALSVAAPAELMITGRAGKAVGNNNRAAFKDTPLHMQGPLHSIHSTD